MKYIDRFLLSMQKIATYKVTPGRAYLGYLLLALVFMLPILIAGVDYIDDNARRLAGYYDWGSLGRFVTELLMRFVTFSGGSMADAGVEMQILCIPLLALAGWLLARTFAERREMTIAYWLVGAVLVVNPFILTNLSFRYDSLSMALAYLLAVYAAILLMREGWTYRWIIAGFLLIVTTALYQPMINIFLVMVPVLYLWQYGHIPNALRRLLLSLGVFAASCVAYFAILKLFKFSNIGGPSRGSLVSLNGSGLEEAYGNFIGGLRVVGKFYENGGGKVLAVALIAMALVALAVVLKRNMRKQSWYSTLFLLASPVIIVLGIMGPMIVMSSSLTAQVRTLAAAVGLVLFACVGLLVCWRLGYKRSAVILVVPLLFISYCLNFSYVYGSALKNQRAHDVAVYDEIDDFLLNDTGIKKADLIYIGGMVSSPKVVQSQLEKRPLLQKMDIAGDNSLWYLWTTLADRGAGKNVQWYVYSYEQEVARRDTCLQANSGKVHENTYFDVYKHHDLYFVWLTDNASGPNNFCSDRRL